MVVNLCIDSDLNSREHFTSVPKQHVRLKLPVAFCAFVEAMTLCRSSTYDDASRRSVSRRSVWADRPPGREAQKGPLGCNTT